MVRTLTRSIIFLSTLIPTIAFAEQVKLYLDNSRTRHIMVEKQDCSVCQTKNGRTTLGFNAGFLFFVTELQISFGKKSLAKLLLPLIEPNKISYTTGVLLNRKMAKIIRLN